MHYFKLQRIKSLGIITIFKINHFYYDWIALVILSLCSLATGYNLSILAVNFALKKLKANVPVN